MQAKTYSSGAIGVNAMRNQNRGAKIRHNKLFKTMYTNHVLHHVEIVGSIYMYNIISTCSLRFRKVLLDSLHF